ncbi:PP2C family serine/threonine-protein phosphatase [Legionella hackeliae]|uniref:Phosphoprotein phosphatase n=1 Tax=Legionella hackeliae TaxID=449 RepID=A0A0A8UUL7_LEGHA|nr:PP2C family serine/threonine-protein phosphatase [Legionella hackeliae]KTD06656.1 Protein phosphatase 2C [Legionella hackeliae]CEK10777.1 Phosphoprotein phosphatase [Legionella hackeliae]STX47515.1 Protein phosphatase 2C [Legionella hackeliae]
MIEIISLPEKNDVEKENKDYKFGCFETIHVRPTQEDALAWCVLEKNTLTNLTPQEIGKRLWTTYKQLDEEVRSLSEKSGTTASTTIYDGCCSLITATLADAAAFLVSYDPQGHITGVTRLNSLTHKPNLRSEQIRVKKQGGFITYDGFAHRVNGILAVSRAIGDFGIRGINKAEKLISSNATIDITNLDALLAQKLQIITTCDGFTDAARGETKAEHENYLARALSSLNQGKPGQKTEKEIAKHLVQTAKSRSWDNISVAIQTITSGQPILLGVYDGHGGSQTSHYVAQHIVNIFIKQCALSPAEFINQPFSTDCPY